MSVGPLLRCPTIWGPSEGERDEPEASAFGHAYRLHTRKKCKPDHALTVTHERDLSTFGGSWCVSAPANPPCAGQCSTTTRPLSVANNRLNSSCK
jgi:hypothetical protein